MKKLSKYANTSSIMVVSIDYNGEKIKFDLSQELKIDDGNEIAMQKDLAEAPKKYAFLLMLLKKLTIQSKSFERRYKRTRAKQLILLRNESATVKEAEIAIDTDKDTTDAFRTWLKIEEFKLTLEAAVSGYEMKKELLQTLAANARTERRNL